MSVRRVSDLKGGGYLVSTASVVLLAIPALKSAEEDGDVELVDYQDYH